MLERINVVDIFGFLNTQQCLAILRIAVGLWWIIGVLHKPLRRFVDSHMAEWSLSLADNPLVLTSGSMMRSVIAPNRRWLPYHVIAGETAVGIGLTPGLLTPIAVLVGIFLNLNYLTLGGVKPRDRSVNPGYQC